MNKVRNKERKDLKEMHELSVRMNRVFGKEKLELLLKVVEQGDKEISIYESGIEGLIEYLSEKYKVPNTCRFLPIPEYFVTLEGKKSQEHSHCKIIMSKNVKYDGYHGGVHDGDGLDYPHAVVAIAALARLHAISYCYTREKKTDVKIWCRSTETSSNSLDKKDTVFQLFKQHPEFHLYSHLFLGQETNLFNAECNLNTFGVLCHGGKFGESVLFKYAANNQAEEEPTDAVFQNLGNCHYGSCIQDLLLLIFSCINQDIRRNFLLEFIGTVYYDAFSSAVMSIDKNITMFDKQLFSAEVKKLSVACGLYTVETEFQHLKQERRKSLREQDNVLGTFRDVLKIMNSDGF